MNFQEILKVAELDALSGNVLFIEGHAGVGKTTVINVLAEKITNRYGVEVVPVILFGAVLKEGEIGGMPVTREIDVIDPNDHNNTIKVMVNEYTIHKSIQKLYEIEKEGKIPLLFVDEINRSEAAVQQELMQLLLAREINGNKLPGSTILMTAGNLESDDIDYQVNVMNAALVSRLTVVRMDADADSWIKWGSKEERLVPISETEYDKTTNIHPKILEFIATYNNMLLSTNADERVNPSPRSWEKASEVLYAFEQDAEEFGGDLILTRSLEGKVGKVPTATFMTFRKSTEQPLIKPTEILSTEPLSSSMIDRISGESISRLFLTYQNIINYINNEKDKSKLTSERLENFVTFLRTIPNDTMYGILQDLIRDNRDVHNLVNRRVDTYVTLHRDVMRKLNPKN